jgi:thioredoxin-like negative regulator of GroEL
MPVQDRAVIEVEDAFSRGNFQKASELAKAVLKRTPADARMLEVVVMAACARNDADEARAVYAKVTNPEQQKRLAGACHHKNIDLDAK